MAVTIEKRPIGVILDTCVTATINQDYSSIYATVNKTSHGLSDGDYVYIQSNVENYNGFWVIEVTNANEFILVDNPYVEWIVDADITYCPQYTTHGWQCVHLPIVYELSNTRWPTNSVDTARTITSISDDNGYLNLNLSGSLAGGGSFEDLAFVKISNCPDSDFDGVYQIIDKLSAADVTINLAYSSVTASGIVGATINIEYSSYNFVVRVYAGINSAHTWADQKPYELAATLEIIPDSDNKAKFSINEILKGYIETKNNLLLATLPNNLDAWCQFYIEVGEQYDTSDGYTVSTFEGAFASDQSEFEGYAVNAMLPFKNIYSGYLSEYVMTNNTAKFLTLFSIPVLFSCGEDTPDCYNDISFINPYDDTTIILKKEFYSNSVLQTTVNTSLGVQDAGVIRAELEADCSYDRVDVTVIQDIEYPALSSFQTIVGAGVSWVEGSAPNVTLGAFNSSEYLRADFIGESTKTYRINYNITNSNGNSGTITIGFMSSPSNDLGNESFNLVAGSNVGYIDVSAYDPIYPDEDIAYIRFTASSGADAKTVTINSYSIDDITISETQQFKIECGCSNQEIRLSWLNYLGGFDYWAFRGETEHTVDITNSGETKANIFPTWPKSYGEHADTIRKQTFRESANKKFIFSQYLTQDEADAIAFIKSSPLVQIVNSRQDRRTVLVDTDSFTKYKDGDKTYSISFNILYTDDIPSQRV